MIDAMFRLAYRTAYQLMRVYWAVRRPPTHGSLVAIWVNQRILLVKNSYVRYFSLPGGYVKSGESGKDAAIRELREEIGLTVSPSELQPSIDESHIWEGKQEHLEIYQLDLDQEPRIEVDHREVVAAAFYSPTDALGLELFPLLRRHIEQKLRAAATTDAHN
jgi:8-oxo-dGTP pyrophosphatase MutT (NUDIX family)